MYFFFNFFYQNNLFEDSLEFINENNDEIIDDFLISPNPPKLINQIPNLTNEILDNNLNEKNNQNKFIFTPKYNYNLPPSPNRNITYHDYKPTSYYSNSIVNIKNDNDNEIKSPKLIIPNRSTSPIISPQHINKIELPIYDIKIGNISNDEIISDDNKINIHNDGITINNNNNVINPNNNDNKFGNNDNLPSWARDPPPEQININEQEKKPVIKKWDDDITKEIRIKRMKNPPPIPDPPTLFSPTAGELIIKWVGKTKKNTLTIDLYNLQYKKIPNGSWVTVGNNVIKNTSYTLTNLKSGHSYVFRVRSHNKNGWSAYSNSSTIYTVPGEYDSIIFIFRNT